MNEAEWIKSVDRDKPAPAVDVANAVMREIRLADEPAAPALPWAAALLASVLGTATAALAVQTMLSMQDPLAGFLDSFRLVLQ